MTSVFENKAPKHIVIPGSDEKSESSENEDEIEEEGTESDRASSVKDILSPIKEKDDMNGNSFLILCGIFSLINLSSQCPEFKQYLQSRRKGEYD